MATKATHQTTGAIGEQLRQGEAAAAAMVRWWAARSDVTHAQMGAIASWGMGARSTLSKTAINRIANGKRGFSVDNLLGLEGLNRAIHLWQTAGQSGAWEVLGPHTAWEIRPHWLDGCIWLHHPDDEVRPLTLCDFLHVLVGRLQLPYVTAGAAETEPPGLAQHLSDLLNAAIVAEGLTARDGVRRLLSGYPVEDPNRQARFREVILGDDVFDDDELAVELFAVAHALRTLRAQPVGTYGPEDLARELQAMTAPA